MIAIATQYAFAPLPLRSELELVVVSVAFAALLYYAIENPARRSKWLAKRRGATFIFGAILIGLSFAVIYWHLNHY